MTRMVEEEYQRWLKGRPQISGWLQVADRCLRRERAAVVRLVKRLQWRGPAGFKNQGYNHAIDDILAALAARKRAER